MSRNGVYRSVVLACVASCLTVSARADEAKGIWLRQEGAARVKIAACGASLCGTIVWLKDTNGPGRVGQRVFFDMTSSGSNTWAGTALNPEDGNTYSGKLEVSGNVLTTTGCAFGGLICKSMSWSRIN